MTKVCIFYVLLMLRFSSLTCGEGRKDAAVAAVFCAEVVYFLCITAVRFKLLI